MDSSSLSYVSFGFSFVSGAFCIAVSTSHTTVLVKQNFTCMLMECLNQFKWGMLSNVSCFAKNQSGF